MNDNNRAMLPVASDVFYTLKLTKNAIGAKLVGGEFTFALYSEIGALVATATNDATGIIAFSIHLFEGIQIFTVRELSAPEGWIRDPKVYRIYFLADAFGQVQAYFPDGLPGFKNTLIPQIPCSLVQFGGLTFSTPGIFEYTMREFPPPEGWKVQQGEYRVVITVRDDGSGNLFATLNYPDGYPGFVNARAFVPAQVIFSATKTTVGAPLECGAFQFGLYDQAGSLVATAVNGANP